MMNARLSSLMLKAALGLVFTLAASAQATRTWVSGVGDDANPCSRTAPCKTFAGAISKTAASGEINCLDSAGYGAVTITKSITIDCEAALGGVLVSGTNGIVVAAGSSDVVNLRNLDINGLSTGLTGISYQSGHMVHVDHVRIYGFTTACVGVTASAVAEVSVHDSRLSECGGPGIRLNTTSSAVYADVENVQVFQSSYGVKAESPSLVAVRNSNFSFVGTGIGQTAAGSTIIATGNGFNSDVNGLQGAPGSSIHSFGNAFTGNSTAMNLSGGLILTDGQNAMVGNGTNGASNGTAAKM